MFSRLNTETERNGTMSKEKKYKYSRDIVCFDTETTSYYETVYNKHGIKEYKNKKAWVYCWGATLNGVFFKGRSLMEAVQWFSRLNSSLPKDTRQIVWVHNLSFEFQFLKSYMKFDEVFCRKSHKVLYCTWGNLEFRCSLFLSNCKLVKLAENEHLPVKKLEGDLDYSLVRHIKTPLTDKEWGYVRNDVLVIHHYIKKKVEEYGSQGEIPLTSTGEVRHLFRKRLNEKGAMKKLNQLAKAYSADNMQLQNLLIQTYTGAYTHANYNCVGKEIENLNCWDIASSYPFQMVARKFPTIWHKARSDKFSRLNELLRKYPVKDWAICTTLRFYNISAKHNHSIISQHKCIELSNDVIIDNGRVNYADILTLSVTDVDIQNIKKFYTWQDVEIAGDIYFSRKEYLPKELVEIVLELFQQKTALKDIDEEVENYMRSKNRINGVYGTTVLNVLDNCWQYDETEGFYKSEVTFKNFTSSVNSPQNYLWYSIGVWVTAYARQQILDPISKMSENAKYCDTDSVKFTSPHRYKKLFSQLNAKYRRLFNDAMKYHKIEFHAYDKKGKEHYLGVFEEEKPYVRFKTWGCKRYLYELENGTVKSTVAGAPKDLADKLGNTNDEKFNNFNITFEYPNCKLNHTYTEDNECLMVTDYLGNKIIQQVKSGICLTPAGFSMNLDNDFFEFLCGKIDFETSDIYRYFQKREYKK